MFNRLLFIVILFGLQACVKNNEGGYDLPFLYKMDIRQGNLIKQEMLDRLRVDMDKEQVRFIVGTPVIIDPFRNDRWDYIFNEQKSSGINERRHIILYFEDDKLKRISGDIKPAAPNSDEHDDV